MYAIRSYYGGEQQYEGGSEGSGIIIREDGYILTNNHVIEGAVTQQGLKGSKSQNKNTLVDGAKIEVILASDINKTYVASVVGRDEKTDLAIIKIDAGKLPAVDIGNSDELKVGELAVAIGNPAGIEYMGSVTAGIISGLNRRIPVGDNHRITSYNVCYTKLLRADILTLINSDVLCIVTEYTCWLIFLQNN